MRRVIKIGTSTILQDNGQADQERLTHIAQGVSRLLEAGEELVLVTSGAVGLGMGQLSSAEETLPSRACLAALGQPLLLEAYRRAFGLTPVAQLLVDHSHISQPSQVMSLSTALHHLWNSAILPLVNENDALSAGSVRIGDNDTLAALIAGLVSADQLLILSDIDGLYTDNPATNPNAERVTSLPRVSLEHFTQFGSGNPGRWGSGGIVSKLKAAHIAQDFGIETVLASGQDQTLWEHLLEGDYEQGTRFSAQKEASHA